MEERLQDQTTGFPMQVVKEAHVAHITQQIMLLNALQDRFGEEVARVVEQANTELIFRKFLAHLPEGKRSCDDLLAILWEPLRRHGTEFTVARSEHGMRITCTACPWATLYRQLGGAEWGYRLYCAADAPLVARFNPDIAFTRTKTLMEGDDCCNHSYILLS